MLLPQSLAVHTCTNVRSHVHTLHTTTPPTSLPHYLHPQTHAAAPRVLCNVGQPPFHHDRLEEKKDPKSRRCGHGSGARGVATEPVSFFWGQQQQTRSPSPPPGTKSAHKTYSTCKYPAGTTRIHCTHPAIPNQSMPRQSCTACAGNDACARGWREL